MKTPEENARRRVLFRSEEISLKVYPEKWIYPNASMPGYKTDQNAGRRAVAKDVAAHFLTVIDSDKVARRLTKAFVRRYANEQAAQNIGIEYCHMLTAMLACEFALKDCDELHD